MELVLLHALPLDGSMWANELRLPFDAAIAPTLYLMGDSLESWARGVLDLEAPRIGASVTLPSDPSSR